MNIAVVGGKGFLGKPLVEKLRRGGHAVEVFDLPEFDIRDRAAIARRFDASRPDAVINLAAVLGTIYSQNIREIFDVNFAGNLNVADECARRGISRYLFASSVTVHGENKKDSPCNLDSPFRPKHPYSASKAAGEYSLMQYAKHHGMAVVVLRPSNIVGMGTALHHAPMDFVTTLMGGKDIELFGKGDHEREWVWVDDVVDGFCSAVDFSEKTPAGYYPFFLSGNRISMSDLAEKCAGYLGGKITYVASTAQAFTLTTDAADSEKILGWRPLFGIDHIIQEIIKRNKGREKPHGEVT